MTNEAGRLAQDACVSDLKEDEDCEEKLISVTCYRVGTRRDVRHAGLGKDHSYHTAIFPRTSGVGVASMYASDHGEMSNGRRRYTHGSKERDW